jgi:hypothetical protein
MTTTRYRRLLHYRSILLFAAILITNAAWTTRPCRRRTVSRISSSSSADDDTTITPQSSSTFKRSSVAIIGSGAIGGYYGARLWQAGHDVHFVMRSDLDVCRREGYTLSSIGGNLHIPAAQLQLYDSQTIIANHNNVTTAIIMDWVLVCVKSTSLECIPELIAPWIIDPQHTRVLEWTRTRVFADVAHESQR